ncbi:creatininase family protein [Pseudofrankia sp. DC12]|uniref:creatininase family protein n=1 Tax=Pseudofrankia sp. DC12 TaxID=683315 RepID=UPI0005F87BFE|nr:creatininase family protein [Pseudofrankia sp. DC12]
MLLGEMTWPAFDDATRDPAPGAGVVIVPVGAVEPHGPHLPLAADTMISDYFAGRLARDLSGALVAPTIGYGVATPPQRLGGEFPGVLNLSGEVFTRLVTEVLTGLACHGLRRLVVVNSAIDNISFLCEAARIVTAAVPGARVMIVNWWDVVGEDFRDTLAAETGVARDVDHHAGMVESSLVMHIAPRTTRPAPEGPAGCPPRRFTYHLFPLPADAATSDGVVYTAVGSSPAIGERVAEQVARRLADAVRQEMR